MNRYAKSVAIVLVAATVTYVFSMMRDSAPETVPSGVPEELSGGIGGTTPELEEMTLELQVVTGVDDPTIAARSDSEIDNLDEGSWVEVRELGSTFANESRDRSWAEFEESRILDRLSQTQGLEIATFDVECRETICHVKAVSSTEEALSASAFSVLWVAESERPIWALSGERDGIYANEVYMQLRPQRVR